jgi:hypothetical protein
VANCRLPRSVTIMVMNCLLVLVSGFGVGFGVAHTALVVGSGCRAPGTISSQMGVFGKTFLLAQGVQLSVAVPMIFWDVSERFRVGG